MELFEYVKTYWPIGILVLWLWFRWQRTSKALGLVEQIEPGRLTMLDVRSREEFSQANAPGSINIPLHELESRMNELSKDQTIAIACMIGVRSSKGRSMLIKHGFSQVHNLGNWQQFNRLTQRQQSRT